MSQDAIQWLQDIDDPSVPLGMPTFTAPEQMEPEERLWLLGKIKRKKDIAEGFADGGIVEALPFFHIFAGVGGSNERELKEAQDAIQNRTASQEQFDLFTDFLAQQSGEATAGYHFAKGIKSIAAFGGEIWATGGLAALGRAGTAKALGKLGLEAGAARKGAEVLGGELVRQIGISGAQTGLDFVLSDKGEPTWGPADRAAFMRAMPEWQLDASDDGRIQLVMEKVGKEIGDEKFNAHLSAYFELLSERMGPALGVAFAKLPLGGKLMALEADLFKWMRGKGYSNTLDEALARLGSKAQIHSTFEEFLEERASSLLHGLTPGMEETLAEVIPTWEQAAGELGAATVPGAGRALAGRALGQSQEELEGVIVKAGAEGLLGEAAKAERHQSKPQTPAGATEEVAAQGLERLRLKVARDAYGDEWDALIEGGATQEEAAAQLAPRVKEFFDKNPINIVEVAEEDKPVASKIEAVARKQGIDVRWYATDSGEAAWYPALQAGEGVVMIDATLLQDEKLVARLLLHESIHDIGSKSRKTLDKLIADLREFDAKGFAAATASIQSDRGGDIARGLLLEEGAARRAEEVDSLVFYLQSDKGAKWLERLEKSEDRGALRSLVDFIRDLLKKVGIGAGSEHMQAMDALHKALGEKVSESDLNAARSISGALAAVMESRGEILPPSERPTVEVYDRDAMADIDVEGLTPKQAKRAKRKARKKARKGRLRTLAGDIRRMGGISLARSPEQAADFDRLSGKGTGQKSKYPAGLIYGPKDTTGRGWTVDDMAEALKGEGWGELTHDEILAALEEELAYGRPLIHPEQRASEAEDLAAQAEEDAQAQLDEQARAAGFKDADEAMEEARKEKLREMGIDPDSDPPFAARRRPGQRFKKTFVFDMADEVWFDGVRRRLQDEFLRIRRFEEALGDVEVDDSVYETVSAASSKMRGGINHLRREFVEPIYEELRAIRKAGGTVEEATSYILARHAPSRNKVIAERSLADATREAEIRAEGKANAAYKQQQGGGTFKDLLAEFVAKEPLGDVPFQDVEKDPGSGIPTSEALATVAKYGSDPHFKKLGLLIDKMNAWSLRKRLDASLLSQEQHDAYVSQWDHYVPFKTDSDISPYVTGGGFSVKGSEFHRAGGRSTLPDAPLEFAIQQAYQSVERAEKNQAGLSFYNLLKQHSDQVEFSEDQPDDYVPPDQLEEGQIAFKKNGKQVIISLEDKLLAQAMGRVGRAKLPKFMRGLNKAVRLFVATRTSLSPDFLIRNFFRDLGTASIHISSEQSEDLARRTRKGVFKAIGAGYQIRRGKLDQRREYHKDYLEYEEHGGLIGWYYTPTIDELEKEVADLAKDVDPSAARRATAPIRNLLAWTDDANHAIENGVRLSLFREMRKDGYSAKEAASVARNVTVDFTKKGEWSSVLNVLFVFSNAGIQGSRKNLAVLKTSRGQKFAAGLAASGLAATFVNLMVGGDDDDGEPLFLKIPEHIRDTHLVIVHPNGDHPIPGGAGSYFMLPLPYGWNSFWALGVKVAEVASGETGTLEASGALLRAVSDSWSPVGTSPDVWQFFSPTLTDPLIQHASNTSWAGNPIMPDLPEYGLELPDSQRHFKSVSKASEWFAKWANSVTGGDEIESGVVDVSPELIDHYFQFLTGSAGAFAQRTVDIPLKLASGEIPRVSDIPVLRTMLGGPNEWFVSKAYYASRDNIERLEARVELYTNKGDARTAGSLIKSNANLWKARDAFKAIDKQVSDLRKKSRSAPDPAPYLKRIDALQRRFNRLVNDGQ